MFGVIFLFANILLVNGVYFSMRNIQMTIPSDRGKFPPGNHALVTLYAQNSNSNKFLRYSFNDTLNDRYLQIYPTTGDVLFSRKFFQIEDIKSLNLFPVTIAVEDSIGHQDRTSLEVDIFPLDPLDCDLIVEDLCYWKSVEYRIYENSEATLVGSLASPYLAEMCAEFKINYTLKNDSNEFELVPPSSIYKSWSIRSTKQLDRDLQVLRKPLTTTCTVENPQGSIRSVEKAISIQILDVNDNLPEAQKPELNIGVSSNVVIKGQLVEHKELIFKDKDTIAVNSHHFSILNDTLNVLRAICKDYENDFEREPQTAVHCKLEFTKNMQIPYSTYSVLLQLNDTSVTNGNSSNVVKVPIHLHFLNESGYHPVTMKKQFNRPLILYPTHEVKVFRTAAPLARITQPTPTHSKDAINFTIQPDPLTKDIFNVTYANGIVFVHDINELRKSSEYIRLNITWIRNKTRECDEIQVRIVEEPTKTCIDMDSFIGDWMSCSEYVDPDDCESKDACAVSTGGSSSVAKRKGPERCMWRGDRRPGNDITHLYATCTPDISTCPDGICDALERLYDKICPQDCAENLLIPAKINSKTGRGIDVGSGVCHCDVIGKCTCTPYKKKNKKKQDEANHKPTTIRSPTAIIQPNVSRHVGNFTGRMLGIEIAKCGTSCMLGIAAGSLFLIGAIALVVICWRLDRVHKAVRGKFSDETQDLSAPLSDYVDRSVPDPIPINFDMTTSLADPVALNAIKKYTPDPKWEFPRNQLSIEQTLGEGEFGRVLRAKAMNIAGQTGYTTVAVKTLKDDARETELNDLLSEYQLLKEVSHPNVIRLLGVCTAPGGPVYLIIEFAEHGSLRNYLRRSRHLKSEMGRLPSSTGIDDGDVHYDQPNVSKVTPKEILSFGWQICKGMAYLSEIKLVHRDLAARNVLVATDKICKISDFGLTRDIYEDDAYFKRSKGRVPVKWMAPESLSDHVYTNKSDVWSFGILVWELVTLGATPYPGIAVQNLFHLLRQGYRMERPDNCSPTLYNIMRSCWHIEPEHRPKFQELSALWEKMLGDEVEYLDLTNNAIHNRSYFCSPFEQHEESQLPSITKPETNPLNYLSKTQPYVKCGASEKFLQENNILTEPDTNQNDINTQGYETPVKVVKKVTTPTNECPQYYTDMGAAKKD